MGESFEAKDAQAEREPLEYESPRDLPFGTRAARIYWRSMGWFSIVYGVVMVLLSIFIVVYVLVHKGIHPR